MGGSSFIQLDLKVLTELSPICSDTLYKFCTLNRWLQLDRYIFCWFCFISMYRLRPVTSLGIQYVRLGSHIAAAAPMRIAQEPCVSFDPFQFWIQPKIWAEIRPETVNGDAPNSRCGTLRSPVWTQPKGLQTLKKKKKKKCLTFSTTLRCWWCVWI